jgi:hypothetical protein
MPSSEVHIPPLSRIRHRTRKLPRIPAAEFFKPKNSKYHGGAHPYILTDVMPTKSSADFEREFTFDRFARAFGTETTDFYPHNLPFRNVAPFLVPLEAALSEMVNSTGKYRSDAQHPGLYALWNMNVASWRKVCDLFVSRWLVCRVALRHVLCCVVLCCVVLCCVVLCCVVLCCVVLCCVVLCLAPCHVLLNACG